MKSIIKKIPLPVSVSLCMYKAYNTYRLHAWKEKIEAEINKQIDTFCPGVSYEDRRVLTEDIKKCFVKHLAKPQEYFLLGFRNKSSNERDEWITDFIKDTYLKKYAKIERAKELEDKFFFFNVMKPYFKREACMITGEADRDSFVSFAKEHTRFIAKPNSGSFGANTKVWNMQGVDTNEVFDELVCSKSTWIIEDLIEQVPEMGQFNPTSVNSVRIPTFKTLGGYKIFGTFMRTGRKGAVVDNAGAGGIFVRIDEETGKIISDGYSELGDVFSKHPDSGVVFKGFQIPRWEELRRLAIECHKQLPEHKYIGWDFALTNDGWVMLEGNWGQFLCQQVSGQKPLKKQFVEYIKG